MNKLLTIFALASFSLSAMAFSHDHWRNAPAHHVFKAPRTHLHFNLNHRPLPRVGTVHHFHHHHRPTMPLHRPVVVQNYHYRYHLHHRPAYPYRWHRTYTSTYPWGLSYVIGSTVAQQSEINKLERENRQLKRKIEKRDCPTCERPAQKWFCTLETNSTKYRALGASRAEAKAKVLDRCEIDNDNYACIDTDVKCET